MSIYEILLICSIGLICHFFVLMKNTLKVKGYSVTYLCCWGSDFYKFKDILKKETDPKEKEKLKSILYGLYGSIALLVIVPVIGMIFK